ncbi:hypothetical protein SBRCBS47491_002751 [Sporothrix bragantina]|uniref:Uncharacterized protein n=1 Tax=Sporothrix bragantina TaxID=671064 RepID=A0ABP0BAE4_9PEZI
MHGLLKAGLLLAPALARGVGATASPKGNQPSAFITLDVPDAGLENGTPFLSLRLDVQESINACGTANVTINGETLPKNGQLSLPLYPDFEGINDKGASEKISGKDTPSAIVAWESDCVSWGGKDREQLMRLRIVKVNGIDVKETDEDNEGATIRFRQTAPARVVLVEGAASVFTFDDYYFAAPPAPTSTTKATAPKATGSSDSDSTNTDDNELDADNKTDANDADLVAWENSLILMHRSAALVHHDIHLRERYIVERFGPDASPIIAHDSKHGRGKGKSDGPCSEITAFIGSVLHKVTNTAKSLYGELISNTFGEGYGPHGSHDGPHFGGRHGGPHGPFFGPSHGRPGFPMRPYCFPDSGRMGPPPPPPPPPSFLFNCPPTTSDELPAPPREGFTGPPFPPKHPHGRIPDGPVPGSPPPPGEGPHHHGGPTDGVPFWMAGAVAPFDKPAPIDKAGEFRGRKMHGHGPDGPPTPEMWNHGGHGHGPHHGPPVAKMVAFFGLVIVLLFVFARHCRNRRIEKRLRNRRANRPRGFRGFAARFQEFTEEVQERHERRQARRERRRQRRASMHGFFRSVRRFLFAGDDDDEKLLAAEAGAAGASERTGRRGGTAADGHIVTSTPVSREQSPAPSLEDEIAQFRVAADVVGQMIAAEEGRMAIAQTAESRRRQQQQQDDEDLERVMRSTSPASVAAPSTPPPAPTAPYNQPPPPPPPPPSMATSSSMYGGYGRRDAAGIDSDFDDTESLPPAYSPDDYQYVNLVEASVVADGFQYRPGSSP